MTRYNGEHRDPTPRPTCTCGVAGAKPQILPLTSHLSTCAVTTEARERLRIGTGGTR